MIVLQKLAFCNARGTWKLLQPVTVEVTGPVGVIIVIVAGEIATLAPNIELAEDKKLPVIGVTRLTPFCCTVIVPPVPLKPSPKESKTDNVNIVPTNAGFNGPTATLIALPFTTPNPLATMPAVKLLVTCQDISPA